MKKTAIIVVILLVVVCGGGWYLFSQFSKAQAEAEKAKNSNSITVGKGDLTIRVVENGTVDAVKSVEVKSRVSGRLAKLFVEEGDLVRQGQLIGVIDQRESKLRVMQDAAQVRGAQSAVARTSIDIRQRRVTAESALRQAEIRLRQLQEELRIQPTLTSTAILSARTAHSTALEALDQLKSSSQPNERTALASTVREAEANLDNAVQEERRRKELLAKGYISNREFESAQLQLALAKTRVESARDQHSRLTSKHQNEVRQAEQRVIQSKADLDRAQANSIQNTTKRQDYENAVQTLRQARAGLLDIQALEATRRQSQAQVSQLQSVLGGSQLQFSETEILAPISGVVSKRFIQVGEQVSSISGFSNGSPIVTIEDRNSLRIKLDINEIDLAKIKLDLPATIEVDAYPGESFKGYVEKIAPSANVVAQGASSDTVVKYKVEVYMDRPDMRLKSGMSAKVTIIPLEKKNVLTVPVEYIGKDDKGSFVMLSPGKKGADPSRVTVMLGASTGSTVEIKSGITAGTKIVKPPFGGPDRKGFMEAGEER